MVLRIEDTDRERSTPENVAQILDSLNWLELDWDEGPIFQSERSARHHEALQSLLESGLAYHSEATADDVRAYKQRHGADRGFRGEPSDRGAVRLHVPDEGATIVEDLIRGDTRFEHIHLDDPVIARADGSALYNFAVAIDDLDARISHVVRGEDHLSNTPKQLLVLEACRQAGLEPDIPPPVYAHLPLLHGPDGKKLSKRHGAASVGDLREAGYLPEGVRNYLALLGWGSGDDTTVLSTEELVQRFTLERVSRNPARFDEKKLRWLNGVHLRALPEAELTGRLAEYLASEDLIGADQLASERETFARAVAISREKIQTLADFWPLAGFIFTGPREDHRARERWLDERGRELLSQTRAALTASPGFSEQDIQLALDDVIERNHVKPRDVYQPLRVALAGTSVSPGIFETVALLGREETLARIDQGLSGA
jgi:glutamyl-tRNA synthetase